MGQLVCNYTSHQLHSHYWVNRRALDKRFCQLLYGVYVRKILKDAGCMGGDSGGCCVCIRGRYRVLWDDSRESRLYEGAYKRRQGVWGL